MKGVFHGWRRKTGGVTLILACGLMIGWLRSMAACDVFGIPLTRTTEWCLASEDQQLLWTHDPYVSSLPSWSTIPLTKYKPDPDYTFVQVEWNWRWLGFGSGRRSVEVFGRPPTTVSATVIAVPYLSLVLPSTLLSGWLLLLRPRKQS